MEILASCTYEESKKYSGKLSIEDPESKKPIKVFINVLIEDVNTQPVTSLAPNVKSITVLGVQDLSNFKLPSVDVFQEVSLEELSEVKEVENVTTLVRLPEDYCDMLTLYTISQERHVRFIGGNLLGIDGVNIGRYDAGKDKTPPVFKGIYDTFIESDISEIGNLQEKIKKANKVAKEPKEKKEKAPKEKKESVSKKKNGLSISFQSLFSSEEEVDF